jgi:hypothetical protein
MVNRQKRNEAWSLKNPGDDHWGKIAMTEETEIAYDSVKKLIIKIDKTLC